LCFFLHSAHANLTINMHLCFLQGAGVQACGELGFGRMLEPPHLCYLLQRHLSPSPLAGLRVTVTAGPTYEAIDREICCKRFNTHTYTCMYTHAQHTCSRAVLSSP
jgi:hypothetical protein